MSLASLKCCVIFALINLISVFAKDCTIPNQDDYGICVIEDNCPAYSELLTQRNMTNERTAFLSKLMCSQISDPDGEFYICCPKNGSYKCVL